MNRFNDILRGLYSKGSEYFKPLINKASNKFMEYLPKLSQQVGNLIGEGINIADKLNLPATKYRDYATNAFDLIHNYNSNQNSAFGIGNRGPDYFDRRQMQYSPFGIGDIDEIKEQTNTTRPHFTSYQGTIPREKFFPKETSKNQEKQFGLDIYGPRKRLTQQEKDEYIFKMNEKNNKKIVNLKKKIKDHMDYYHQWKKELKKVQQINHYLI